jgi:hypothetical protein
MFQVAEFHMVSPFRAISTGFEYIYFLRIGSLQLPVCQPQLHQAADTIPVQRVVHGVMPCVCKIGGLLSMDTKQVLRRRSDLSTLLVHLPWDADYKKAKQRLEAILLFGDYQ